MNTRQILSTALTTFLLPAGIAYAGSLTRGETQGIKPPYGLSGYRIPRITVTAAQRKAALNKAYSYIGTPYVWGGESQKGIDCSGLILQSYRKIIPKMLFQSWVSPADLDATAMDLYYYDTRPLDISETGAGDLIFMTNGKGGKRDVTHVVMVKSVGDKWVTFINATPRYGKVMEETWDLQSDQWKAAYVGAGRLMYIAGNDYKPRPTHLSSRR